MNDTQYVLRALRVAMYVVADFTGEAGEVRRHVSGCEMLILALNFSRRFERYQSGKSTLAASRAFGRLSIDYEELGLDVLLDMGMLEPRWVYSNTTHSCPILFAYGVNVCLFACRVGCLISD